MIVDALIAILVGFFAFVLDLLPAWSDPDILGTCLPPPGGGTGLQCQVRGVMEGLAFSRNWLELSVLGVVINVVLGMLVVAVTVKSVLWLYGKLPFKSA